MQTNKCSMTTVLLIIFLIWFKSNNFLGLNGGFFVKGNYENNAFYIDETDAPMYIFGGTSHVSSIFVGQIKNSSAGLVHTILSHSSSSQLMIYIELLH